jgi:hypothetical protein
MDLNVFKRAMIKSDKWDSVSFNRIFYYDIWALSIDQFIYSCWGWNNPDEVVEMTRSYITDKLNNTSLDEYVECRSAFGGFAIYKTAKFIDCLYDWRIPKQYMELDDLEKNHQAVGCRGHNSHTDSPESHLLKNSDLLPSVTSHAKSVNPIDEMDCEHRSFHMMATAKNGARIRITPEKLFYPIEYVFLCITHLSFFTKT